jgi:hypothetical protein
VSVVNSSVAWLLDGLLLPFSDLPAIVGLTALSALTAVGMLLVVRATSNQARIAAVKRAMQACIYEVRLFGDDARAMLRAMAELVRHNLTYLALGIVPLLWMIVPLGLLVAHLHVVRFAYTGLVVGGQALVKARLADGTTTTPVLEVPAGVRIETPLVWIPSLREAVWRIRITGESPSEANVTIRIGNEALTKSLTVSNAIVRTSPVRPDRAMTSQLMCPAESPIPAGTAVESIAITYPSRSVSVFGWNLHWMVVFFVLSMVFAFLLRRPLKVVL